MEFVAVALIDAEYVPRCTLLTTPLASNAAVSCLRAFMPPVILYFALYFVDLVVNDCIHILHLLIKFDYLPTAYKRHSTAVIVVHPQNRYIIGV